MTETNVFNGIEHVTIAAKDPVEGGGPAGIRTLNLCLRSPLGLRLKTEILGKLFSWSSEICDLGRGVGTTIE
jgi:hypothetical protein